MAACRRAITARATLLYQHHRIAPFAHIHRHHHHHKQNRRHNHNNHSSHISHNPEIDHCFQHRLFGMNLGRRFSIPAAHGLSFVRNLATFGDTPVDETEIGDKAAEAISQVASEVAVAASDSFFPVGAPALQYLIDYVHFYTGFNWWASIVLTTILIRCVQLPGKIHHLKCLSKLHLLRPQLEEIREEIQKRGMSPAAMAKGRAQKRKLYKDHGVSPFTTTLKGILIDSTVFWGFFLAIRNMVKNVPSFKEGGAFWFTNLTTPDSMYIFPVLTALTYWIMIEKDLVVLESSCYIGTLKNFARFNAALIVPFTAFFPKAMFCYWITHNLFSLAYGLVLKRPQVKKLLGIPIIPAAPSSTTSFFETYHKLKEAQHEKIIKKMFEEKRQIIKKLPEAPTNRVSLKPTNQIIAATPVPGQRVKNLEKEVKGREKGKKKVNRRGW